MPFKKVELSVREEQPLGIIFRADTGTDATLYNGAIPVLMEQALLMPARVPVGEVWDAGEHYWQAFAEDVTAEHLIMLFDDIHAEAQRIWNEVHAEHMMHGGTSLCQMTEEELASVHEMQKVSINPETCTECKRRFREQVTEVEELTVSGKGSVGIILD